MWFIYSYFTSLSLVLYKSIFYGYIQNQISTLSSLVSLLHLFVSLTVSVCNTDVEHVILFSCYCHCAFLTWSLYFVLIQFYKLYSIKIFHKIDITNIDTVIILLIIYFFFFLIKVKLRKKNVHKILEVCVLMLCIVLKFKFNNTKLRIEMLITLDV